MLAYINNVLFAELLSVLVNLLSHVTMLSALYVITFHTLMHHVKMLYQIKFFTILATLCPRSSICYMWTRACCFSFTVGFGICMCVFFCVFSWLGPVCLYDIVFVWHSFCVFLMLWIWLSVGNNHKPVWTRVENDLLCFKWDVKLCSLNTWCWVVTSPVTCYYLSEVIINRNRKNNL